MKKKILIVICMIPLLSLAACATEPAETEQTNMTETVSVMPEPTEAPTQTPTPEPTSIQATCRQDLIDYGFVVKESYSYGPTYTIKSKASDAVYTIQFVDNVNELIETIESEGFYCTCPFIKDETRNIIFFEESFNIQMSGRSMTTLIDHGKYGEYAEASIPVVLYYPNIDTQISSAVSEQLEEDGYSADKFGYYLIPNSDKIDQLKKAMPEWESDIDKTIKERQFTVRADGSWDIGNGVMSSAVLNITDIVSEYIELEDMRNDAMQKFKELNENLIKEFGLSTKEILALK